MSDEEKADAKGKEEEGEEGGDLEKNMAAKKKFEVKKWAAVALWVRLSFLFVASFVIVVLMFAQAWDIVVDNCAICRFRLFFFLLVLLC
jgi:hypothetical protein